MSAADSPMSFKVDDDPISQLHVKVNWKQLIFVAYLCVCGGAFGSEPIIQGAGPALGLLMLVVLPLVWNLPVALTCCELASMFPSSNEGAFVWVKEGLSPAAGFVVAVTYYLNYVLDTTLYPALFVSYFRQLSPVFEGPAAFWGLSIGCVILVVVPNVLGVRILSKISLLFTLLMVLPFFVFIVWAFVLGWVQPSDWLMPPPGQFGNSTWADAASNLGPISQGLNVALWGYSGYDALGSFVLQLDDAQSTLPKMLIVSVIMSVATYLVAMVSLLGAHAPGQTPNYADWDAGFFARAAFFMGGTGLKDVTVISALIGCYATFNALMLPISQQLNELAGPEWLDISFLQWRWKRFDTPAAAIVLNGIICLALSVLGFDQLVLLNNFFYAANLVLIMVSYCLLRFSAKGQQIPRVYRAVTRNAFVLPLVLFPILISMWLLVSLFILDSWVLGLAAAGAYASTLPLYFLCNLRKRRGWCWASTRHRYRSVNDY